MSQYTFTADEGIIKNFYVSCFKGIQLANSVISYGDITEDSSVRLQYVDEARFIRAWYYFQLVQQFGPVALNKQMFDHAEMSHERADVYKRQIFSRRKISIVSLMPVIRQTKVFIKTV